MVQRKFLIFVLFGEIKGAPTQIARTVFSLGPALKSISFFSRGIVLSAINRSNRISFKLTAQRGPNVQTVAEIVMKILFKAKVNR